MDCFWVFGLSTNEKRWDQEEKDEQRQKNPLVNPLHERMVSQQNSGNKKKSEKSSQRLRGSQVNAESPVQEFFANSPSL
jgi:hypothetical protein